MKLYAAMTTGPPRPTAVHRKAFDYGTPAVGATRGSVGLVEAGRPTLPGEPEHGGADSMAGPGCGPLTRSYACARQSGTSLRSRGRRRRSPPMTSRPADPSGLTTHNLAALMPPEFWEFQARYDRVSRHRKQNDSGTGQIPKGASGGSAQLHRTCRPAHRHSDLQVRRASSSGLRSTRPPDCTGRLHSGQAGTSLPMRRTKPGPQLPVVASDVIQAATTPPGHR